MRYSIGLDISAGAIRLIKLYYKTPSNIEVKLSAKTCFNPEAIIDGRIKDPSVVIAALIDLVQRTKIKNKKVVIGLPYQCVISKRLKLSRYLQEKERIAEINAHLKQYLPGVNEDLSFDFIQTGQEEYFEEWLLFVAKKSQLEDYLNIVVKAGLKISRIDLDVYAFMRGVQWSQNYRQYIVVVHFCHLIRFIVADRNEVIVARYLPQINSTDQFIHEIKTTLEMHAVPMQKVERVIVIGKISFDLDELSYEFAIHKIGNKELGVESEFLMAFGLALEVKHVGN